MKISEIRKLGLTTAGMLKAISDAILMNGGKVEYRDHYTGSYHHRHLFAQRLNDIIKRLELDIDVTIGKEFATLRSNHKGIVVTEDGRKYKEII